MVRVFIAVELSEEQRENLESLKKKIRSTGANIKFVEKENLHVTMLFLGEISENDLKTVEEECVKAVEGLSPFGLSLHGVSAFPGEQYIKIVWAGVKDGAEDLVKIKENLDKNVSIGMKDMRKFAPHITIGRVRDVEDKKKFLSLLDKFKKTEFGKTLVKGIKVKKSTLTPEGPVYEDVCSINLS